jgi:hypothetical protein
VQVTEFRFIVLDDPFLVLASGFAVGLVVIGLISSASTRWRSIGRGFLLAALVVVGVAVAYSLLAVWLAPVR